MRSTVKVYCCCFFLIVPWTGHFITICPCSIIATGCCYKYKTCIVIPTAERRQGTCLATIIILTPPRFRSHSVHHLPFVNPSLAGTPFPMRPLFLSALHSPTFPRRIRCGSTIPLRRLSTAFPQSRRCFPASDLAITVLFCPPEPPGMLFHKKNPPSSQRVSRKMK